MSGEVQADVHATVLVGDRGTRHPLSAAGTAAQTIMPIIRHTTYDIVRTFDIERTYRLKTLSMGYL